jgi:ABC-type uncharacterized transport system fused permease/ATPase subunit
VHEPILRSKVLAISGIALLAAILEVFAAGVFSILVSSELGGRNSNLGLLSSLFKFTLTSEFLVLLLLVLFMSKLLFQFLELHVKNKLSQDLYKKWFKSWVNTPTLLNAQNPILVFQRFSHNALYPLVMILSEGIFLLLFLPIAFIISFNGTVLISIACLAAFLPISFFAVMRLKELSTNRSESEESLSAVLWDTKRQYEDLGGTTEDLTREVEKRIGRAIIIDSRYVFWSSYPRFTVELAFILVITTSLIFIDRFVPYDGRIQFFAILGYGFFRLIPVFSRLISAYSQLKANLPELLSWYKQINNVSYQKTKSDYSPSEIKSIKLADSELKWVEDRFGELLIQFGKWTLIQGESGTGKTTFLNLISKPWEFSATFLVNNETLVQNSSLPSNCGYVSQEPYISESSFVQVMTSIESKFKDLKSSDLLRIGELNSPWVFDLGARSLSGGQRKQLALIRALASKPDLLILDEFPAGLDFNKATRILGNLRKEYPGITLIMTSHEKGYETFFDEVLVIEND